MARRPGAVRGFLNSASDREKLGIVIAFVALIISVIGNVVSIWQQKASFRAQQHLQDEALKAQRMLQSQSIASDTRNSVRALFAETIGHADIETREARMAYILSIDAALLLDRMGGNGPRSYVSLLPRYDPEDVRDRFSDAPGMAGYIVASVPAAQEPGGDGLQLIVAGSFSTPRAESIAIEREALLDRLRRAGMGEYVVRSVWFETTKQVALTVGGKRALQYATQIKRRLIENKSAPGAYLVPAGTSRPWLRSDVEKAR